MSMAQSCIVALTAALSLAGQVQASTVQETVSGVISGANTVDTMGYFGPAGADLKGMAFTVAVKYVSEDFNKSGECRNKSCNYYTASGTALVPESVAISITIKGTTQTYKPVEISAVFLSRMSPPFFAIDSDTFSGIGGYGRGVQVNLSTMSNPKFGAPLSPRNPPLLHTRSDLISFFEANSQSTTELLNLNVKQTAR